MDRSVQFGRLKLINLVQIRTAMVYLHWCLSLSTQLSCRPFLLQREHGRLSSIVWHITSTLVLAQRLKIFKTSSTHHTLTRIAHMDDRVHLRRGALPSCYSALKLDLQSGAGEG